MQTIGLELLCRANLASRSDTGGLAGVSLGDEAGPSQVMLVARGASEAAVEGLHLRLRG